MALWALPFGTFALKGLPVPIATGERRERKQGTWLAVWIGAPLLFLAVALVLPGFRPVRFRTGNSEWMIRSEWGRLPTEPSGFSLGQIRFPNGPSGRSHFWSLHLGDWLYEVMRFGPAGEPLSGRWSRSGSGWNFQPDPKE